MDDQRFEEDRFEEDAPHPRACTMSEIDFAELELSPRRSIAKGGGKPQRHEDPQHDRCSGGSTVLESSPD